TLDQGLSRNESERFSGKACRSKAGRNDSNYIHSAPFNHLWRGTAIFPCFYRTGPGATLISLESGIGIWGFCIGDRILGATKKKPAPREQDGLMNFRETPKAMRNSGHRLGYVRTLPASARSHQVSAEQRSWSLRLSLRLNQGMRNR